MLASTAPGSLEPTHREGRAHSLQKYRPDLARPAPSRSIGPPTPVRNAPFERILQADPRPAPAIPTGTRHCDRHAATVTASSRVTEPSELGTRLRVDLADGVQVPRGVHDDARSHPLPATEVPPPRRVSGIPVVRATSVTASRSSSSRRKTTTCGTTRWLDVSELYSPRHREETWTSPRTWARRTPAASATCSGAGLGPWGPRLEAHSRSTRPHHGSSPHLSAAPRAPRSELVTDLTRRRSTRPTCSARASWPGTWPGPPARAVSSDPPGPALRTRLRCSP